MKVFVSYASEHRSVAENLAAELKPFGHKVFLDRHALAAGETYTDQIRRSIEQSDLFVFLISPEAVTPGRYTMTELQVMQELAPSPGRRVLPVMASATPLASVPDYLRNLTILSPKGDLVTDTLNAIAGLEARAKWRRMTKAAAVAAGAAGLAAGIAAVALMPTPPAQVGALKNAFDIYGTNFLGWGEQAVVNLTNKRPDLVRDYTCRVDARGIEHNLVSIEHDDKCGTITMRAKMEPFVEANEKLIGAVTYDREPFTVEVMGKHGDVIWRGSWEIGLQNFVDPSRFSIRKVDANANPIDVAVNAGSLGEHFIQLLFDSAPLPPTFSCRSTDEGLSFEPGSCVFRVTGYYASEPTMAANIIVEHPKTQWTQDILIDNRLGGG